MLGITIPEMFLGYILLKRKGNGLFLGKTCFLEVFSINDVTISGKECFIKLEWVVQLR